MKRSEMPIGFSMTLTENPEAIKKFALLSEEKKQTIVEGPTLSDQEVKCIDMLMK